MYSFLSKKISVFGEVIKKDRKKDRGRDSKKETLFWLITCTHVIRVFDALLAGRKSGRKLQCLRANTVTNNLFFCQILILHKV